MGDYMLSKCLIGATQTGKLEVMRILATASKKLSKGELMQIEKSKRLNINEQEYFEVINNKTAALISSASELGALSVSDDEQDRINLQQFGENLGIAFQIKDDLLDYYGQQLVIGKPVGNDMKDKKLTLPLIYAFDHAPPKEIKSIKRLLKKGVSKKDIKNIIGFAEKYNGIEYAKNKYLEYAQLAKENISSYPDSDVRKSLMQFVDYVVQRKK